MNFDEFLKVDFPFQMGREQVIDTKNLLDEKRQLLREAQEDIDLKFQFLRNRCKHPNSHTTYCMGESGTTCNDCGLST